MASTTKGKVAVNNGLIKKMIHKSEVTAFLEKHPDWRLGYPFYKHKLHSEETKRKISEAHKHVDKTIQIETLRKLRDNPTHENWKRSHSKRFKGRWNITNGESNKLLPESEAKEFLRNNPDWYRGLDRDRKEVMRSNNTLALNQKYDTSKGGVNVSSEELAILRILRKYYGEVIHSHLSYNRELDYYHVFDFFIPKFKLAIEFDGAYWHKDQDYDNDPRKAEALRRGWKYLVIKENDYLSAPSKHKLIMSMISSVID